MLLLTITTPLRYHDASCPLPRLFATTTHLRYQHASPLPPSRFSFSSKAQGSRLSLQSSGHLRRGVVTPGELELDIKASAHDVADLAPLPSLPQLNMVRLLHSPWSPPPLLLRAIKHTFI